MIPFLEDQTNQLYALIGGIVIIWIIVMAIIILAGKRKQRRVMREAAEYVPLQITQTSHGESDASGVEEVRLFEDLLQSIILEKKPIAFEVAVPNDGTDILFFIAVPAAHADIVRNQVRRVFERAQVQEVPDNTNHCLLYTSPSPRD